MVLTGSRLWRRYYSTYTGSASSGKSSEYFEKLSLPASKSSIHEWVRWMGGRLNFDSQEYSIIAVDEGAVKCNGTPIYVWAAMGGR